jgi:hypothetical protein
MVLFRSLDQERLWISRDVGLDVGVAKALKVLGHHPNQANMLF